MPLTADALLDHLDYSAWASRRLVAAVAALSPEDLARDFGTADKTVIGTLAHTFAADRIWFSRVSGAPAPAFISESDRTLATLQNDWPALHARWRQWAQTLTDDTAQQILDYKDLKGNPWRQSIWEIVLHVVNHATHHRGQVSGFLRTLGHTPPPLDLIAYYRQK